MARKAVPELGHFIGGKLMSGRSGRRAPVFDPSLGTHSANVSLADETEVDRAVAAAHAAFAGWSNTTPLRRARVLFEFKSLLEKHRDELAAMISAEHGKDSPTRRARSHAESKSWSLPAASRIS